MVDKGSRFIRHCLGRELKLHSGGTPHLRWGWLFFRTYKRHDLNVFQWHSINWPTLQSTTPKMEPGRWSSFSFLGDFRIPAVSVFQKDIPIQFVRKNPVSGQCVGLPRVESWKCGEGGFDGEFYPFSHNHGTGKLPQMKRNDYWRDPLFTVLDGGFKIKPVILKNWQSKGIFPQNATSIRPCFNQGGWGHWGVVTLRFSWS